MFISLVAYGVGPSLHWVLLLGGWSDYSVRVGFELKHDMFLLAGLFKTQLKEQCHKDFAVLGQFCAKIITWRLCTGNHTVSSSIWN